MFDHLSLQRLRCLVDRAAAVYYTTSTTVLSDADYDSALRRLRELCPEDPRLVRVGWSQAWHRDRILTPTKHSIPMGSLNNALNVQEFSVWRAGLPDSAKLFVSLKLDGASLGLVYRDRILVQAITRGDGVEGEDVTANAFLIGGIPHELPEWAPAGEVFVRGEVLLPRENFQRLAQSELVANPRNTGNGILRRKTGENAHLLEFRAFRLHNVGVVLSLSEMYASLDMLGFDVAPWVMWRSASEICQWRSLIGALEDAPTETLRPAAMGGWETATVSGSSDCCAATRAQLRYDIDGLVVSVSELRLLEQLGIKDQRPNGEVAFKFPPHSDLTTIEDVEWQIGRTGKLTPVARVAPVSIGGVTIRNITLCNPDEIQRLDVALGDSVTVTRQGDVIPKIVSVAYRPETRRSIEIPSVCPHTGGAIERRTTIAGQSADIYSEGFLASPLRLQKHLQHWAATVDYKGWGPVYIQALNRWAPSLGPAAFYQWTAIQDMPVLQDLGGKNHSPLVLSKLREEVEATRSVPIELLIGGLGIPHLGRGRVKAIVKLIPEAAEARAWLKPEFLRRHAERLSLPTLGPRIAESLETEFFQTMLQDLLDAGVTVSAPLPASDSGWVFCLTGAFPGQNKDSIHAEITAAGHHHVPSYTKSVTHLVAADPDGSSSKLVKARRDGKQVIDLDTLRTLLQQD